MKKINLFIRLKVAEAVIVSLILCAGCESFDFGIEDITFYDYEIFSGDELDFYGKWKFVDYYGGFTGAHKEPTYDYLKMKSSGVYEIYKGLKCIEKGKIVGEFRSNIPNGNEMMYYQFLKDGVEASDLVSPGALPVCCNPNNSEPTLYLKKEYHQIFFREETKVVDGEEITTVDRNELIIIDDHCSHIFKRVR